MIQLDLQPEIEAQLATKAQNLGLSTAKYVEQIVSDSINDDDQALQEALNDAAQGHTVPAHEAFAQLREEYDIRG